MALMLVGVRCGGGCWNTPACVTAAPRAPKQDRQKEPIDEPRHSVERQQQHSNTASFFFRNRRQSALAESTPPRGSRRQTLSQPPTTVCASGLTRKNLFPVVAEQSFPLLSTCVPLKCLASCWSLLSPVGRVVVSANPSPSSLAVRLSRQPSGFWKSCHWAVLRPPAEWGDMRLARGPHHKSMLLLSAGQAWAVAVDSLASDMLAPRWVKVVSELLCMLSM
jgi:hypothetical protein